MFLAGIQSVADTNPSRQHIAHNTPEKTRKKILYFRVFSWAKSFAGSYPRSPFPRGRVSREQVSGRQQELAPTGNIEIYGWQPSQALFSQQMYR